MRFAACRSDHAGSSGAAVLPAVGPLPHPAAASRQGHLAALWLRGPSQWCAAAAELRLLTGPAAGELQPRQIKHSSVQSVENVTEALKQVDVEKGQIKDSCNPHTEIVSLPQNLLTVILHGGVQQL